MASNDKFYVVVRSNMPAGVQAVQSAHALLDFSVKYPDIVKNWNTVSNYLCMLSVDNEDQLYDLYVQAVEQGIRVVRFYEPDMGDELTAIALEPGCASKQLCSKLKLALRGYSMEG